MSGRQLDPVPRGVKPTVLRVEGHVPDEVTK
jgi:hypothetical protein